MVMMAVMMVAIFDHSSDSEADNDMMVFYGGECSMMMVLKIVTLTIVLTIALNVVVDFGGGY